MPERGVASAVPAARRALLAALACCLCSPPAGAQADALHPGWEYARFEQTVNVESDGRFVRETSAAIRASHARALALVGQRSFAFSETLQRLEVLEAYTVKKTGDKVRVPAASILTRREAIHGSPQAPIFDDRKVTTIVFPNLEVGDTVHFTTRLTQLKAPLPGYFSMHLGFNPQLVWRYAKVSLTAPKDLPLFVQAKGVDAQSPITDSATTTRTWTFVHEAPQSVEPQAVDQLLLQPHIMVSSFADYGAVAAAYEAAAAGKAALTPEIRRLAEELTRGVTGEREQARRLYEWVAGNIRYVAVYLGESGFVPHDAQTVLDNRYGDCKDHVVLLEALLAAKGIRSTPVLIDTRPNYRLPAVPVLGFNHLITYLPGLDLYVDSTDRHAPFGLLPFEQSDKPVVHTRVHRALERTPATGPENAVRSRTVVSLAADGGAEGEFSIDALGSMGIGLRRFASAIPASQSRDFVAQSLGKAGIAGSGLLSRREDAASGAYRLLVRYKAANVVNTARAGTIALEPLLREMPSIGAVMQTMLGRERSHPYACATQTLIEEYAIELPEGLKVAFLPKSVDEEGAGISYSASYRVDGAKIRVVRRLDNRVQGNVCPPSRFNELQPFAQAVLVDLKTQLVVEPR